VLIFAGASLAQRATSVTGKFQSFKDGTLKIKLRDDKEQEYKLDAETAIVSVTKPKEKLAQATAFDGVEAGRIIRVFVKGKGEDAKVEAVQIAAGAGKRIIEQPGAKSGEDLSKAEPKFTVTAEELHKEFKTDKKAAETKYQGQVVEVKGTVNSLGVNVSSQAYVDLEVPKEFVGVMCYTADKEPWAKVAPGQQVKLKGRWPKGAFSAQLMNCVFTEAKSSPAISITAKKLVQEYMAAKEGTRQKYHDKWLIVDGELASIDLKKGVATIKGDGDTPIKVGFGATQANLFKAARVGRPLKVLGRATIFASGNDALFVENSLPISQEP
jgi:hypothetical protein